jgi:pyruvate dehydrogenase E2 component (dihydrolipoamide acetyltransferase)
MAEVVTMPKLGFDMAEGVLVRWVIAEGEAVERGKVLAEIETDKATVEVESAFTGVVHKHLAGEGDVLPVGVPIAVIAEAGENINLADLLGDAALPETAPKAESALQESAATPETSSDAPTPVAVAAPEGGQLPGGVKASPVARRMAQQNGLDLSAIRGTGPGGRIIKADIQTFLSAPTLTTDRRPTIAETGLPSPVFRPVGEAPADQIIPTTKLRQAIGRRLVEAKQQVPHFYVTTEYDMAPVMALRQQVNGMLEGSGEKLSVNDFIVKAVALTLRQFPNLNASLRGTEVVQHGQVNVGVAVAVEGGLLTVVNRDTDRKSLRQISAETRQMVVRARDGKVRPDDIEGSTFSVSNLGMYDVEHFIAIINPPEVAILAVGSAQQVPVVVNGELAVGWRMKATISVDHRVSDGAEAAQFMQALKTYLEEPLRLMI